ASTDLANIAARHKVSGDLDSEFRRRFFQPAISALRKCAASSPDPFGECAEVVDELENAVKQLGLTNFGVIYAREAARDLGFRIREGRSLVPEWVSTARALAQKNLEEWRIPGTENILVVISYELWFGSESLQLGPTVVTTGWPEGIHEEVKAMLRPVDARGWSCQSYSERVALLELLEAAREKFGEECLAELSGWVRLYHSHHTSVTGFGIFCQFRRQAPKVVLELDYDGGWHSWAGSCRPLTTLSSEENLYYYS
ncbi:unnamed protein product, partial [Effrenium voratum]